MNISSFMSVKDYFNYYVSGWLWLAEAILVFLSLGHKNSIHWLTKFQAISDKVDTLVFGIFLVIIPYVIGFTLSPISVFATKVLRYFFDDPKEWIIDHSKESKSQYSFRHENKRLSQTKIRLILKRLKQIFGDDEKINEKYLKNWFFPIRAFVINNPGEAAAFAIRAHDLVNFTESIMLPVPLILLTIGITSLCKSYLLGLVFIVFGVGALYLLAYRYMKLRFYWVKHIYNTFLVLTANKPKAA